LEIHFHRKEAVLRTEQRILVVSILAAAVGSLAIPSGASEPKFYDDDPLWVEPITQDVTRATDYEPNIGYTILLNIFSHPGEPVLGQRAKNVNTVDEVPDGPFFVNRAGRIPLTPALVARAANTDEGPAPGAWTVVEAKSTGVTPGFTIRDSRGTIWFLKFDPIGWRAMATGSEVVGAKLFWALGYHTTEYHIVRLVPSNIVISDEAKIKTPGGKERPMRREDLDEVFARTARDPDGSYRAVASKAIPGTYVGRIRYYGTRRDDPNDLVPHEHHRELRGYYVFCAWLNRVDCKRQQSVLTVLTENGRKFIRRYIIDWSSCLGSGGVRPREYWKGFERYVERFRVIGKRLVALGAIIPKWRLMAFYQAPAVGRLPRDENSWDPDSWQPLFTNAAFRHARADDKFWAAYKMTFISEEMVRAAVAQAQFGDSLAGEHLIDDIMARRARIFATYLTAINPIVEPVLGNDSFLRFRNAAVEFAAARPPRGYRAVWSEFDNTTGKTTPIGVTEASDTAVPVPRLPVASFLKVELSCVGAPIASWEAPLTLYFRHRAGAWELVGLQRM
jgi:hypothetical protein